MQFYAGHCTLARGQCLLGTSCVPKQCRILSCVYVGDDETRLLNYIAKPDLKYFLEEFYKGKKDYDILVANIGLNYVHAFKFHA